jgi:plasmid stabilization system protein ParE
VPASEKLQLEWAKAALAAYDATLARIAEEDSFTAEKFEARVDRSIALILANPSIGTPGSFAGRRIYAVPGTGHSFIYRVTPNLVQIVRWYRQRQNVRR